MSADQNNAAGKARSPEIGADSVSRPMSGANAGSNPVPLRHIPFEDYDRERRISATGAFGRVPYNPPAGSLES